ncbi:MAG TPA: tetratricopeptide repeat protein [Pyrinomonadaceae bacterium]
MNLQRTIRIHTGSEVSLVILIGLAIVAAAITAIGCAWPGTSHSVRFNSYQSEREMGRLPPLPTMANGLNEKRAVWDVESDDDDPDVDYSNSVDGSKKTDSIWERAETAEKDGNLHLDRDLLTEYLKAAVSQVRRNSAIDRLDVLNALDHGPSTPAIRAYLNARRLYDRDKPDESEIERALEPVKSDRNLRDNVAYLNAARQYRQNNFEAAAGAFKALAQQYAHSEKREAALFMTAVATMKTSATYVPASGNAGYDYGEQSNTTEDQAWHDAFAAFQKVINEYPHGKYSNDARGWQAYLWLRRHDRAAALAQYYRLLADKDEHTRIEAAFSLQLVRSPATDDEMARVENELANEPQAALAYAYHNIYNYSIDPGPDRPPYEEVKDSSGREDFDATRARSERLEKEWRTERADTSRKELARTLEFSKRLMVNHPDLSLGGAFALRASQASEELEDNAAASQFARRALQNRLNSSAREQALWTLGIAEHRLHHLDAARKNFTQLLHDYPKTNLSEAARRNLAMMAEDAGDIDGALKEYIALKYDIDQAYFVDTLMTPEQLSAFIQKHPESPKKNEFTYALGVRYLRQGRWEDARKAFAQVQTGQDFSYDYYCSSCNCKGGLYINCTDPKEAEMGVRDDNGKKQVSPQLLLRDVQTANDLEVLERSANEAVGDEAKAKALYQYASYQYEASSLLFYNPLASPGYYMLGEFAGEGRYRIPNESKILFDSQQEHERLARALKIYLQVADEFPRTRAARDALYTAAVCHERLSNYNPYWRQVYENGLHAADRMVTYADVKAAYPRYQLPQGTYGWQPKTRTVSGGPGWSPPLKPEPRLTKRQRLRLILASIQNQVGAFWRANGKRWLTEIAIVLILAFTLPIAKRNQRRLRMRIARQRLEYAKEIVSYPWFDLFAVEPENPRLGERLRILLRERQQEFVALARDRRGRPALLRSLVSHSAVSVLIASLIWTMWSG